MKKKHDQQVEELQKQIEEWKNKYLRALADYQNLEKHKQAEIAEIHRSAGAVVFKRLLPIIDTFERAQAQLNDSGLGLALKELKALLVEFGVEKMQVVGRDFNPHQMECVEAMAGDDEMVIEEVLPGYMLRGKVLRVAQVKVGKKITNKQDVPT